MHPLVWVRNTTGAKDLDSSKRKPFFLLVLVLALSWFIQNTFSDPGCTLARYEDSNISTKTQRHLIVQNYRSQTHHGVHGSPWKNLSGKTPQTLFSNQTTDVHLQDFSLMKEKTSLINPTLKDHIIMLTVPPALTNTTPLCKWIRGRLV
jgi:hypothetical protein